MRIPNNYDVAQDVDGSSLTVVDDSEFSQFITGQKEKLSPEMRKKVRAAMKDAGTKLNIFFMAVAQKNANRLARIMGALDCVDKELLQPWRVKTMNQDQLMDLYSELNVERHRSTKSLLELSDRFAGETGSLPVSKKTRLRLPAILGASVKQPCLFRDR